MKPHRGQWKPKTKTAHNAPKVTRIKGKTALKILLREEGYDRIAIWADGVWADVGTGYDGEQDGDNPVAYIQRSFNYDLTHKEIGMLISSKEAEIQP